MAITREKKEQYIKLIEERLKKSKIVILANYTGITVEEIHDLRNKFREQGIDYGVFKNSLIKIAAKNQDIQIDKSCFGKPLSLAFGYEDEVTPSKIIYQFSKEYKKPEILGGILEGNFIGTEQIKILAQIPSREQLYANLVGSIAVPISGLVYVLKGNLYKLVSVLTQYQKGKA